MKANCGAPIVTVDSVDIKTHMSDDRKPALDGHNFFIDRRSTTAATDGKTVREDVVTVDSDFFADQLPSFGVIGRICDKVDDGDGEEFPSSLELDDEDEVGCCCCRNSSCCRDEAIYCRTCARSGRQFVEEVGDLIGKLELRRRARQLFSVQTIKDRLPITKWLPKYRLDHLQGDIVAGLTVGLTVIPQSIAYAKVAELHPQYGLYASFVACFVYTLFGSSKDLAVGPVAIISLLTASLASSPIPGDATYAILVSLIGGCIQLFMGLFNIGFVIDYISHPVVNSFTTASALTIAQGQLKKWLGLKVKLPDQFIEGLIGTVKNLPNSRLYDFLLGMTCLIMLHVLKVGSDTLHYNKCAACCGNRGHTSIIVKDAKLKNPNNTSALRALQYFIWLLGTARNAIIVLLAGAASAIFASYKLRPFSASNNIPPGLPPFRVPQFTLDLPHTNQTLTTPEIFSSIGAGFIVIPLLAMLEAIAVGKAFGAAADKAAANKMTKYAALQQTHLFVTVAVETRGHGTLEVLGSIGKTLTEVTGDQLETSYLFQRLSVAIQRATKNGYRLDANQELVAIGIGNILGSFVSAYPVTGSFSRTAVNSQSGVKTPFGGIITGILVILSLLFLTPYFNYIPDAALSAVIIAAVADLVDFSLLGELWRVNKSEVFPWMLTFAFSLGLGVEYGILTGVGWTLLTLLWPWNRPAVKIVSDEPLAADDGLLQTTSYGRIIVLSISHGNLFPSIERLKDKICNNGGVVNSIVLDFTHVAFVDYTTIEGLGHLMSVFSHTGNTLIIAGGKPHILTAFKNAKLKHFLRAPSTEAAVQQVRDIHNARFMATAAINTVNNVSLRTGDVTSPPDVRHSASQREPYGDCTDL